MEFYLEALDRDIRKPHENPSVGIILCKSKDKDVVEYALSRNMSSTMISEYRTKLISKEILQKKLEELYDVADENKGAVASKTEITKTIEIPLDKPFLDYIKSFDFTIIVPSR